MISFLFGVEYEERVDYSLDGFTQKNIIERRQHFLKEFNLIEVLVDLLHLPFKLLTYEKIDAGLKESPAMIVRLPHLKD